MTVKRNGVLRDIENEGKRQLMPWFFYSQKQYADLNGMDEGRNNALFSHKCRLDNHEDTLKIMRFINTVIFDSPLDEEEFQHLCRDYDPSVNGGGK